MKVLKIEKQKGLYYSIKTRKYVEIDRINKDEISDIITYILKNDNTEIDDYTSNSIDNKAQEIVYKDICGKLIELVNNKEDILNDIKLMYKDAKEKYM